MNSVRRDVDRAGDRRTGERLGRVEHVQAQRALGGGLERRKTSGARLEPPMPSSTTSVMPSSRTAATNAVDLVEVVEQLVGDRQPAEPVLELRRAGRRPERAVAAPDPAHDVVLAGLAQPLGDGLLELGRQVGLERGRAAGHDRLALGLDAGEQLVHGDHERVDALAQELVGDVDGDAGQRAGRRSPGAHHRARRQDPDREDLPACTARSPTRWRSTRTSCTRIENLFPGRDFQAVTDTLHNHGTSSIQYGRGSVLTIDLTNRCNMMCDPCFMDANQVGYVHELTFDDVKKLLDDAISIKPRRQMTVQFSGGEPTISPIFLESVAYARKVGYFSVQAATNGIRFAQEPDYAKQAHDAGLRIAYLQFDGIGEEANSHRKVGNLFDVKLRAIENLHAAGIDVALVVTIVNTVNNDQVGPIIRFAMENCDKISFVSFQPVSFTGRDEDISTTQTGMRQRYTLSHLARGREAADRRHRAAARLVSAVGGGRAVGRHRSAEGAGRRLGHDEVRLPPELRHRRPRSWSARRRRSGRRCRSSSTSSASSTTPR